MLVPVPVDLSKLSDIVKIDVVKKIEYDELFKKINDIKSTNTSDLVKKKLSITQKLMILKKNY